tara:strand:- start:2651 stop:3103 length:453 start_codon:yes stop_codon:yes gene_type:complete
MDPFTAAAIASTALSTVGSIKQGQQQASSLNAQAKQKKIIAGQVTAESQRKAIEDRRQSRILQSKARAGAAAGGGSTTDVGITNLLSDIAGEGELSALTSLFEGNEEARGLRASADIDRFSAKQTKRNLPITALAGVAQGAALAYAPKKG